MVATEVVALLQLPPGTELVNVADPPTHTVVGPVITPGAEVTVTIFVVLQVEIA